MKLSGFTDIHCHMLPQVDDGAASMETALAMLDTAYEEGIRNIIFTPHYHGGHCEPSPELLSQTYTAFVQRAADRYGDMKFYEGSEIYYYASVPQWIEEGKVRTMAGSSYVLLEFSPGVSLRELNGAVNNLTANGHFPILAHTERYQCLYGAFGEIKGLIAKGAYIQVNAEAISGEVSWKTKHQVKKMIKEGLVHFVATDAHNLERRGPYLKKCAEYLCNHYGECETERLLIKNPSKMIHNEYIDRE